MEVRATGEVAADQTRPVAAAQSDLDAVAFLHPELVAWVLDRIRL